MLEVRDLWLRVPGFELSEISLSVDPGECHVIMGPTGAGKTLVLESIVGLRRPCAGEIFSQGKQIVTLPVEERQIGFVPQDLALFPHLTVEENVLYGVKRRKFARTVSRGEVMELCEAVGITHLLRRDTSTLSGGEKQRVALVRALAPGCRLLLLDEPFAAVHRQMRKDLWLTLKRLQEKLCLTVLVVTHDMEEAMFLGDSISVLICGRIHQTGNKLTLFRHPRTVQIAKFMGIANFFRARMLHMEDEALYVSCDELKKTLVLPRPLEAFGIALRQGMDLVVGVRGENIKLLRDARPLNRWDNILEGVISGIFEKGSSRTILVIARESGSQIEVDDPTYGHDAGSLKKEQRVVISLSGEDLILFPESASEDIG